MFPPPAPGRVLGLIFAGHVPLALSAPTPFILLFTLWSIAWRVNDIKVTNLQFLSEFCHFSHLDNKRQTNITFG